MRSVSDQGPELEYWFKPVEEWLPAPVVRIKDIRTKKIIEFSLIQDTEKTGSEQQLTSNDEVVRSKDYPKTRQQLDSNDEVVRNKDDHETDSNNKSAIRSA